MTTQDTDNQAGGYEPPPPFATILQETGLSNAEASEYLGVRMETLLDWKLGRREAPDGALWELKDLTTDIKDVVNGLVVDLPRGAQRKAEKIIFQLHQERLSSNT